MRLEIVLNCNDWIEAHEALKFIIGYSLPDYGPMTQDRSFIAIGQNPKAIGHWEVK